MENWVSNGGCTEVLPPLYIVSDAVGVTGQTVARATAACFGDFDPLLVVLPSVQDPVTLTEELDNLLESAVTDPIVLFYTLVDPALRSTLARYVEEHPGRLAAVDVMGRPMEVVSQACGLEPTGYSGGLHSVNANYYRRIDAMEFTVSHDDGRNPQDLPSADIVLLGVSRSSKTPLSMYLSQQGYKVANVPLDFQTEPPKQIFDVDPSRIFGLMISPETLQRIRSERLGKAASVAGSYADMECIYKDLEDARALMRRLGAIVIRTDNRAIEETAQEILRYYEVAHPKRLGNE